MVKMKDGRRNAGAWRAAVVLGGSVFLATAVCRMPVYAEVTEASGIVSESDIFVVRYEDLADLLEQGNFSLSQTRQTREDEKAPYVEMYEILKWEQKSMEDTAESYEDEGNTAMQEFYENQAEQLKKSAGQINRQIDKMTTRTTERAYEKQADALTLAAQTLMNSYSQLSATVAAQEKSTEAAELSYEAAVRKGEAGLMKTEEVQQAKNAWAAQKQALESMKSQTDRLKQNLLTMLGLEDQENVVFGEIPVLDQSLIEEICLEEDIQTAISYDPTYVSEKKSNVSGSYARELKAQRVEDAASDAEMSLRSSYETLRQRQLEYTGAVSDYEAACSDYAALQRKKQSGLVSKIEFAQGEAQYLMKKASFESASGNLYQAYQNYKWEVKGIK